MQKSKSSIIKSMRKVIVDLLYNCRLNSFLLLVLTAIISFQSYVTLRFIQFITEVASNNVRDNIINKMMIFIIVLVILQILSSCTSIIRIKFFTQVNAFVNSNLKKKLSKIKYENFESTVVYEKINRVNEKVVKGYTAIVESIVKVSEIIFYIVFYTIFLSQINVMFAILIVGCIIFSGIIATKMSKTQYKMMVDITNLNQERDYLENLPKNKISHQEHQTNRLFENVFTKYSIAYDKAAKGYLKIHFNTILCESKALISFTIVTLIAYFYVCYNIASGVQQVGILVTLVMIFDTLYNKSEKLSYYISNSIGDMLCVSEYYEILDLEEEVTDSSLYNKNEAGDIILKKISYTYPQSDKLALNSINLKIKKGEKIAIVGENGSGKTTFANILLGLLTNFDGEIKIGNQIYDKNNSVPLTFAKSLGQDFVTFQLSIKDNITIGNQDYEFNNAQIDQIVNTIGLSGFVNSLPKKSETNLGQLDEEGIDLSKGQQQKLVCGRLLSNPQTPIWIFDEPTAYLDPIAEIEMYDFLYKLSKDKTMLFISHRLGFAKKADKIMVIDKGQIVEYGTHEELLNSNGKYAKMYQVQKGWYE